MLKYYYILWVDAVLLIRRRKKNEGILEPLSIMTIPLIMNIWCFNFLLFFFGIKINLLRLGHYFLSFLGIENRFFGICIGYLIIIWFNYFIIFKDDKIECLIQKYPNYNGKIAIPYFLISILVPMFVLVVSFVYVKYVR